MRRAALAGVCLAALLAPAPASAHLRTGRIAVDYRAAVERAPAHVSARVYPGDRAIRLGFGPGHTLVVYGYLGEPLARVGSRGATVSATSPTAAAAKAVVSGRSVVFHDPRITGGLPGGTHRARWSIAVAVDGRRESVSGELVRVPRPPVWPWLALGAPFAAVAAAGLRRRRRGVAALVVGGLVVAALVASAGGFALATNATEGRWVEAVNELVFAAVGAIVLVRGRPQTRAVAAGALGLLGLAVGASKIPVFAHGVVLSALPAHATRAAVATMLWASAAAAVIGAAAFAEELD